MFYVIYIFTTVYPIDCFLMTTELYFICFYVNVKISRTVLNGWYVVVETNI